MNSCTVQIIPHNSPLYHQAVELRLAVLRGEAHQKAFSDEELKSEKAHVHIAALDEEGRVIGTAMLADESPRVKMQRVAVAPDVQGQGIGADMLAFSEDWAAKKGFTEVYVHARDTAVPFYEKHGFSPMDTYFDEDGLPHLKMNKRLTQLR